MHPPHIHNLLTYLYNTIHLKAVLVEIHVLMQTMILIRKNITQTYFILFGNPFGLDLVNFNAYTNVHQTIPHRNRDSFSFRMFTKPFRRGIGTVSVLECSPNHTAEE